MRDPSLFIREMLDAVNRALRHASGQTPDSLTSDELRSDAVIRCLIVLGEACKQVPPELRALSTDLPWRELAGMRDILTHGYFKIDPDVVNDVVFKELPALKVQLERLVERLP